VLYGFPLIIILNFDGVYKVYGLSYGSFFNFGKFEAEYVSI
jgi:hypothetical protein